MKKLIAIPLEDGSTIVAEVEEPAGTKGFVRATSKGEAPGRLALTLEESLQTLSPAIRKVRQALNEISNPNEVELKFGIKLTGEVGAIFSSVSTEANFEVTLKWKNESRPVV